MPGKKIRVHELSKKLGLTNDDMLKFLHGEGIEAKSHSSSLDEETAEFIAELYRDSQIVKEEEGSASTDEPVANDDMESATKRKKSKEKSRKESVVEALPEEKSEEKSEDSDNVIHVKPPIVVKDLAEALKVKANVVIMELMGRGIMANINQSIDEDVAKSVAEKHGFELVADKRAKGASKDELVAEVAPDELVFADAEIDPRPPIVAFLGHVDHGKTSLQDKIRNTNVVDGEAGAITQHVGASSIKWQGHEVTFIDTPGHEAFTAMRARGANVTDVVVLVVAADDGFMPQTIEALNHAKAAGVGIIVAINKMDLPAADPEKIYRQMMEQGIMPEDWGGEYAAIKVSAETGEGLDDLLERIVLESEIMELKANAKLPGQAVVLESELEQGLGATTNVLVRNGTIRTGDVVLANGYYGKVKALIDAHGKRIKSAGPSCPVKLVGLNGVANCGDKVVVCKNEKVARKLAAERLSAARQEDLQPQKATSLEDLLSQMNDENMTNLKVIVKSDVKGTLEAVCDSLTKLESSKIKLDVILKDVGAITENDVLLASATNAIVVGFHVRVNPGVNKVAKAEGVEINLYTIIYELIDKIKMAMEGRLEPEFRERVIGKAKILQIFKLSKKQGNICGSTVTEGSVKVGAKARVFRDGELVYNGDVVSLRRFQDNVKEVKIGMECGIKLDNFKEFEIDDVIEIYLLEEFKQTL